MPPSAHAQGAQAGPLAAHGRRHTAGGAQNWGGAGHPKEKKEGAAAPSTAVHRGPGGPLAAPKAAGVTPAAVNPRRRCRRREENRWWLDLGEEKERKKMEKKRKGKKEKRKRREGKEMAGFWGPSPASWWPEAPVVVVVRLGHQPPMKKKEKRKVKKGRKRKRKEKEKEKEKERE